MINDFPCSSCGECCRHVQDYLDVQYDDPVYNELINRFPYNTNEDGSCEMLTKDGLCSAYENRPLLCNLKKAALLAGFRDDSWMQMQAEVCNRLIDEAGLDNSYKIVL